MGPTVECDVTLCSRAKPSKHRTEAAHAPRVCVSQFLSAFHQARTVHRQDRVAETLGYMAGRLVTVSVCMQSFTFVCPRLVNARFDWRKGLVFAFQGGCWSNPIGPIV